MTTTYGAKLLQWALFAAALLGAAALREGELLVVDQAILWLPAGVAVAGLWLLGAGSWWIVAACTVAQRLLLGYDLGVASSAAVGSTGEALLGAYILRQLGLDGRFERLRDLGAVVLAATLSPAASISASWLGRIFIWKNPGMAFYSGWGGWWRMNFLGVLAVVPLAVSWFSKDARGSSRRPFFVAAGTALAGAAATYLLVVVLPQNMTGVMLLVSVLAFAPVAGVLAGPRAAVSTGGVAAIVVALATITGKGPFLAVARPERHTALQLFELLLLVVPLLLAILASERRTARRAAAEGESSYRALVESLPDVVLRFDRTGRLVYASENVRRLGAEEPSSLLGRNALATALPEPHRRHLDRAVATVLETGAPSQGEVIADRADGLAFHSWQVVPERDEGGVVGRVVAVGHDLTARRRAEEEVRRLNEELEARIVSRTDELTEAHRELKTLSYSFSHELRAPLRAIDSHAAIVAQELGAELDDELRHSLGAVRWNAQRMGRLLDDLLAFSRTGRIRFERAPVDMTAAARRAFERIAPDPQARPRLVFRLGELPPARGDAAMLQRVFEILLSNALKFSAARERPVVEVSGSTAEDTAVYAVHDNGVGFDMRYAEKLFGVFQRLHAIREFEGTGVGLALARRIVVRHGGYISGESELGRGATFTFSLPRAPESPPG